MLKLKGPLVSLYEGEHPLHIATTTTTTTTTTFLSNETRIERITRQPIRLELQHELSLTLHALTDDVIRVTIHCHANPLPKSHMILNGKNVDTAWEGRISNDLSHHARPPATCVLQNDHFSMTTKLIRIHVNLSHDGISLEWFDVSTNQMFLQDCSLMAYTFQAHHAKHALNRFPGELYYGFGEASGSLDKAGRRLRVDAGDAMGYNAETSDPLYKHCPFYITLNPTANAVVGILYDTYHRAVFDMGQEISAWKGSYRYFDIEDCDAIDYYVLYGGEVDGGFPRVSKHLVTLLGSPRVPPSWALGYLGSSMTYAESGQEALENFPQQCMKHEIPCDGFHLSSGYTVDDQGRRCVFTWNPTRVPNPAQLFQTYANARIHIIANIKPWLLLEHPQYKEMAQGGGFLRATLSSSPPEDEEDPHQHETVPAIQHFWKGGPGTSGKGSYVDFSNTFARDWWKLGMKSTLLAHGCVAAWCDNNEYEVEDGEVQTASGIPIKHFGRSLQTLMMARTSAEALKETESVKGKWLVVSRSGAMGTHRYAAQTWSGDNTTSWHTMRWNIPMCLSLGLCLWVGNGPDTGGFAGERPTEEMFLRWVQLGVWLPRFSIHSSSWKTTAAGASTGNDNNNNAKRREMETVNEPWMFPNIIDEIRTALRVRCRLKPMLYSLHVQAALSGTPVVRPLVYHYAASGNREIMTESFQFLLGRDVLCVPILEPAATSVSVLFPDDVWFDLETGLVRRGNSSIRVPVALDGRDEFGIPIYLRHGGLLVLGGPVFENNIHTGADCRDVFVFPLAQPNNVDETWTWIEEFVDDGDECVEMTLTRQGQTGKYVVQAVKMTVPSVGGEKCARCGFKSHVEMDCVSKKDVTGGDLQPSLHCTRCGRSSHTSKACYAKSTIHGEKLSDPNVTGLPSELKISSLTIRELGVNKDDKNTGAMVWKGQCQNIQVKHIALF